MRLSRLKEPSTWAGLSMLGMIFGVKELAALGVPEIMAGLAAAAAIFLPESKDEKGQDQTSETGEVLK